MSQGQLNLLNLQPLPSEESLGKMELPTAVLPPAPPPEPETVEPFLSGSKVVVAGALGTVVEDLGLTVTVARPGEKDSAAKSFPRGQVRLATAEELEADLRQLQEQMRLHRSQQPPRVDCGQCAHFRPYCVWPRRTTVSGVMYTCAIGAFPSACSVLGLYGINVGCRKFEQGALHGQSNNPH